MASRGVNKFIGIGRLGKDPEIRYTPGGDAVASFSIAISETWKDKTSGEQQERTEWVQCVAWRRLAEVIGEYLNKGSKIYVEGKLQTRKWQDQQGQDRYTTEVIVSEMQMLDSKPSGGSSNQQQQSREPQTYDQSGGFEDDEDIPFFPHEKRMLV